MPMDKGKINWIDYLDIVDGDLSHWNDRTSYAVV